MMPHIHVLIARCTSELICVLSASHMLKDVKLLCNLEANQ